jgi:hypothetical protein
MREDARPVGQCLDADTLAAWSEGGLTGKALATAEAHAASCVRCQAILAAIARTATVADGLDTRDAGASSPSAIVRGVRWLVPLAGAAAAAAIVLAIWPGTPVQELPPLPTIVAPSTAPTQPVEPASPPPPPPAAFADRRDALAKTSPGATPSADAETRERQKAANEKAKEELKSDASARAAREDELQRRLEADGLVPMRPRSSQATPEPVSSPKQAADQVQGLRQNQASNANQTQRANQNANQAQSPAQAQAQNAPQSQTQVTQALPPPPASPASPPPAARATPVPVGGAAGRAQKAGALEESVQLRAGIIEGVFPALIATPDSTIVWRILKGRDIQRSQDSGASWTTQTTVPDVQLSSGACPTTTVCWVVGNGGSVLRTTDGQSWQRIPFIETTDLVVVTASNPDTVVVTAKDGRRFSTRDAGKSWTLEK